MSGKPTPAQRKILEYVRDHPRTIYDSHCGRQFPVSVGRQDTFERCFFARWLSPPVQNEPRTWELTEAGRKALEVGRG